MNRIRTFGAILTALVALTLAGCGSGGKYDLGGTPYQSLTASQQDTFAAYTAPTSRYYDPSLASFTNAGYQPYYKVMREQPRIYLIKGDPYNAPTMEAPHVVLVLKSEPTPTKIEFGGEYFLQLPPHANGNKNNHLECRPTSDANNASNASGLPATLLANAPTITKAAVALPYRNSGRDIGAPKTQIIEGLECAPAMFR